MFAGIIEKTVRIVSVEERGANRVVHIEKPPKWKLTEGASVAVDGICSTVIGTGRGRFTVEYMPETLRCSTAKSFTPGRVVNLERSLRYGFPVDGHFVQGHVDGEGIVTQLASHGRSREITIRLPKSLVLLVRSKGSITVNGVALTVARMTSALSTLALVPYTISHTNLGGLAVGSRVNIEVDLIAQYIARYIAADRKK